MNLFPDDPRLEEAPKPLGRATRVRGYNPTRVWMKIEGSPQRDMRYRITDTRHWMQFYFRISSAQRYAWLTLRTLGTSYAEGKGDLLDTPDQLDRLYMRQRRRVAMAYQPFMLKRWRTFARRYGHMITREDWQDLYQTCQVVMLRAVDAYSGAVVLSGKRFRKKEDRPNQEHNWAEGKFVDYLGPLMHRTMRMGLYAMYSGWRTMSASQLMSPQWLEYGKADGDILDEAAYRRGNLTATAEEEEGFRYDMDGMTKEARRRLSRAVELRTVDLMSAGIVTGMHPRIFTGNANARAKSTLDMAYHYDIRVEEVKARYEQAMAVISGAEKIPELPYAKIFGGPLRKPVEAKTPAPQRPLVAANDEKQLVLPFEAA